MGAFSFTVSVSYYPTKWQQLEKRGYNIKKDKKLEKKKKKIKKKNKKKKKNIKK